MSKKKDYMQFCGKIREALQKKLPKGYRIEMHKIVKNNNMELDSLNIMTDASNLSPNFYLQSYFRRYQEGEKIQELAEEMMKLYYRTEREQDFQQIDLDLSVDACRGRIFFRLVSGERNEENLNKRPFIPFLDLAITFQLLLYHSEDGIGSIAVTNELQEKWGISTKELFQLAQENSSRMFPSKICYMKDILEGFLSQEEFQQEFSAEYRKHMDRRNGGQGEDYMDPLVISNSKGINGASVILYPDLLAELSECCEGDFYLLPSSIHEILAIPASRGIAPESLQKMVCDVNASCVQEDEVLSDQIYYYSVQERILEIAGKKSINF